MHARLGEIQFVVATNANGAISEASVEKLTESVRRFCRSIELCDGYLRGYYGLKTVSMLDDLRWYLWLSNTYSQAANCCNQLLLHHDTRRLMRVMCRWTPKRCSF
jgi:hypothetical protein